MKLSDVRWGWAIGGALLCEVVLVALAFAWIAIYSYTIHPRETAEFYRQYAIAYCPWVSLLGGLPAFYLACRWIGMPAPAKSIPTALMLCVVYLLLDAPLLLVGTNPFMPAWLPTAGFALKFLAAFMGARSVQRPA